MKTEKLTAQALVDAVLDQFQILLNQAKATQTQTQTSSEAA